MGKIKLLDKGLINKIAAGEVVERPASVVKELLENSLDAGATTIRIDVKEAGKKLIKVKDNGKGMEREDAKKSIQRHATSKIKAIDDLFGINTLGFRGEALASISSVSKMVIMTRPEGQVEGTMLEVENGKILECKKTGCPKGTIVEVMDLFYNTPARKKYMKSVKTELRVINNYITNYILGYPEICFELIHNDKKLINAPKSEEKENLISIYGHKIAKSLIRVSYDYNGMDIGGYISKPHISRSSKKYFSTFINGRYLECKQVREAVKEAYDTMLEKNKYPVGVIKLNIDPQKIDVNVHPAKKEIRFSDVVDIKKGVRKAVREVLKGKDVVPSVKGPSVDTTLDSIDDISAKYRESNSVQQTFDTYKKMEDNGMHKHLPNMKIVGQIGNSYIVCSSPKGLILIDQHAAQEKVFYIKYMNEKVKKQYLVQALVLNLSPDDYELVLEHINMLDKLGFVVEDFGPSTIRLKAVPNICGQTQNDELFMDIIGQLNDYKNEADNIKKKRIATKACKSAIKAGEELTRPQIRQLINDLDNTKDPYTCPHGRPTIVNISFNELEKMFKRR